MFLAVVLLASACQAESSGPPSAPIASDPVTSDPVASDPIGRGNDMGCDGDKISFEVLRNRLGLWPDAPFDITLAAPSFSCAMVDTTASEIDIGYETIALSDGRTATMTDQNDVVVFDPLVHGSAVILFSIPEDDEPGAPLIGLAELPDGRVAALSGGVLRIADTNGGQTPVTIEASDSAAWELSALPDGRIAVNVRRSLVVLDPGTPALIMEYALDAEVSAIATMPDGRIALAWSEGGIGLWDPATEKVTIEVATPAARRILPLSSGHLAVAADGFGGSNSVSIWDPASAMLVAELSDQPAATSRLVELADGRLALARHDGAIQVWDFENSRADVVGLETSVVYLAQHDDGYLHSAGLAGNLTRWDLDQLPHLAPGSFPGVTRVAELPDGSLATLSDSGEVLLWDAATPSEPRDLTGGVPINSAFYLTALADGRLLVTTVGQEPVLLDPASGTRSSISVDLGVLPPHVLIDGRVAVRNSSDIELVDLESGDRTTIELRNVTNLLQSADGDLYAIVLNSQSMYSVLEIATGNMTPYPSAARLCASNFSNHRLDLMYESGQIYRFDATSDVDGFELLGLRAPEGASQFVIVDDDTVVSHGQQCIPDLSNELVVSGQADWTSELYAPNLVELDDNRIFISSDAGWFVADFG